MSLVRRIQYIGLFAEECCALVENILLDNLGSRPPIFNSKWIVGVDVARCSVRNIDNLVAPHTLAMELRDAVLTVSAVRVTLLNAQLRGELA